METKTMKAVFTVVERSSGKSSWTRVGVGFVNQDGSMNLRLDAIPVNGMLQVREWEPFDRRGSEASNGAGGGMPGDDGPRIRRREGGPGTMQPRDLGADAGRAHFPGDALV
jgi:hypothetical protein